MTLLSLAPDFPQALLATVAVRATAILAAAWLLTRALSRAAAATRHAVWTVTMASLILLPAVSLVLPRWEMPAPVAPAPAAMPMAELDRSTSAAPSLVPAGHEHASMMSAAPAPSRTTIGSAVGATLVVALWILGAVFGVGRLSAGWAAARRLVGRATPMPGDAERAARELAMHLGIARDVRVRMSDTLTVPVNCGLLRPVILLPAAARDWSADRLRVVLLHELAHVRRWDYASLLAMETARAIYWMNPLVWLAARRANIELERACDDEVLSAGTRSVEYAEHLYQIAASLAGARTPRGALAMAQPSTLRARVGAILAGHMNRAPLSLRALAGAGTVALLVGLPLGSLRLLGEGRDAAEVDRAIGTLRLPVDATARVSAAWTLGNRGSSRAVPSLVTALRDPDPGVRGMAAWALGRVKDRDGEPALVAALADRESYVREMAVLGLSSLGDRRAVDALAALAHDPEMGVRGVLTDALGKLGGTHAVAALADLVLHDPDDHVRGMAAWSLRMTGGADAVPTFLEVLHDSSAERRGAATRHLAELRDGRSFDPLVALMQHDPVPYVRGGAAWALGALEDPRATEPLTVALRDTSWNVRVSVAAALGKTPGPRAIDALIGATRDPVHQVRLTAVNALDDRAKQ